MCFIYNIENVTSILYAMKHIFIFHTLIHNILYVIKMPYIIQYSMTYKKYHILRNTYNIYIESCIWKQFPQNNKGYQ